MRSVAISAYFCQHSVSFSFEDGGAISLMVLRLRRLANAGCLLVNLVFLMNLVLLLRCAGGEGSMLCFSLCSSPFVRFERGLWVRLGLSLLFLVVFFQLQRSAVPAAWCKSRPNLRSFSKSPHQKSTSLLIVQNSCLESQSRLGKQSMIQP